MSSNRSYFDRLNQVDGVYTWNFDQVKGSMQTSAETHTALRQEPVRFQRLISMNALSVEYKPEEFANLASILSGSSELVLIWL